MEYKTDLRVYKTKKALVAAMTQLLNQKTFEEITVQKICDVAMIRRATFYTHFADKYELFSYTVREQYSQFPSFQKLKTQSLELDIYREFVIESISFLEENPLTVQSLIKSNSLVIMINIMCDVLAEDLSTLMKDNVKGDLILAQTTSRFYISGVLNTYIWWIKEKPSISKDELIEHLNHLITSSFPNQ